jgi:predicted ATPase
MPEMLRIKADTLLSMFDTDTHEAEALLLKSLNLARSNSALAWELRTAISLSRLWSRSGRDHDAQQLLPSIYGRFVEGFDTADLRVAGDMIEGLGCSSTSDT